MLCSFNIIIIFIIIPPQTITAMSNAGPAAAAASTMAVSTAATSIPLQTVMEKAVFTPQALKTNLLHTLELEEIAERTAKRPVPLFYSGSILRVTFYDSLSEKYPSKLVGIVVCKRNSHLGSTFIVRNVINEVALQKLFHTYSPLIQNIEVLRLCRRRRAKLYYLRDRPEAV